MAKPKGNSQVLTIYLIKDKLDLEDIIQLKKAGPPKSIRISGYPDAQLYLKKPDENRPKWLSFFDGIVAPSVLSELFNASSAALLLLDIDKHKYALTFGHARHLLTPGSFEERFGLRVCLNSAKDDGVKSIDKKTIDSLALQSRDQVSKNSELDQFGIDIEQDLLRAVTCVPEDHTLGVRMAGKDLLCVSVKTTFAGLPDLIIRYFRKYKSKKYQKQHAWIDQISEVSDVALKADLDEKLVQALRNRTLTKIWMAVPEIIEWHEIEHLYYSDSKRAMGHADLHVAKYLDQVRDPGAIDLATLKRHNVFAKDPDGNIKHRWNVYDCLYGEISYRSNVYLLSNGKWHCIDQDFTTEINDYFRNVTRKTVGALNMIDHDKSWSEHDYCKEVCKRNSGWIQLADRKVITHGGGHSSIEFCDLYTNDKKMIHIKKYAGSSVLSHLFAQGRVSAETVFRDQDFRQKVNDQLKIRPKLPKRRPDAADYEIVFGIISQTAGDLDIPFFSKVNLRQSIRALDGLGYNVSLCKIPSV